MLLVFTVPLFFFFFSIPPVVIGTKHKRLTREQIEKQTENLKMTHAWTEPKRP